MTRTHSIARVVSIAALCALGAAPALAGGSIAWDRVYDDALARAGREKKPLFIAINMDGDPANDRMAEKVYSDPRVVALSTSTVNVIASRFDHAAEGKPCERFDGVTCTEHKHVDVAVRTLVVKADESGYVVAPQHAFLAPDGSVILSVPFEVGVPELEWCFHTAIKKVDPASAKSMPPGARAPRRVIMGGVFDPSGLGGANLAPPTREQTLELIKELKAGMFGPGREQKLLRVLTSSEPEALKYVAAELKNDMIGRRGWVREDPENPDGPDRQTRLMHSIGVLSPPVYWEVVAEYLDHDDHLLRQEAVVALEQLAAPASVKALLLALPKEKLLPVRKDLARALGSAGAGDEKALKALLKIAGNDKEPRMRVNAILALGWSSPEPAVDAQLAASLEHGAPEERSASAFAMAISRNEAWIEPLQKLVSGQVEPELKKHAEAAVAVLKGGPLSSLRGWIKAVAVDEIERERFFGRVE